MTGEGVLVLGAGAFAVEVTSYLADAVAQGRDDLRVSGHLVLGEAPVRVADAACARMTEAFPAPGTRVVLAVADVAARRALIDGLVRERELVPVSVIHPSARVTHAVIEGAGNVIGPDCYVGAGATLGDFNVLHYHASIGHHSQVGSNNFFAPSFNCGAEVVIGDDNLFGLATTIAPGVRTGGDGRFQAGLTVFDDMPSGSTHVSSNRVRSVQISRERKS